MSSGGRRNGKTYTGNCKFELVRIAATAKQCEFKRVVCKHCGITIEYVPNEVRNLYSGTDIGGGPDGAAGFNCPKCYGVIVTKSW